MMLQSALEEEVTGYLQRDYYERSAEAKGSRSGSTVREVRDVANLDNLLSDGELAEGKSSNQTHKPSSDLACCKELA